MLQIFKIDCSLILLYLAGGHFLMEFYNITVDTIISFFIDSLSVYRNAKANVHEITPHSFRSWY